MAFRYINLILVFTCILETSLHCNAANGAGTAKDPLRYYIVEELEKDNPVGNFATDMNIEISDDVTFVLLDQPDMQLHKAFYIENKTGIILTAKKIDRETVCSMRLKCTTSLDIAVLPKFQLFKLIIEILDINDNLPVFPVNDFEILIAEDSTKGSLFQLPAASDEDSAKFGVKTYVISNHSNNIFTLRHNHNTLQLKLLGNLDREARGFYNFSITVQDGGDPQLENKMFVKIVVTDVNDNDPKFQHAKYEAFVPENATLNTTIVKVKAEDNDMGLNAEIVYYFAKETRLLNVAGTFKIDPSSGEITLNRALDYEDKAKYILEVAARDRGLGGQPAHAIVVVWVSDVNDNPPQIRLNTLTEDGVARVTENSASGTFVAHAVIRDQDGGLNGEVFCDLDDRAFDLEQIYAFQYKIVTARILDREVTANYTLQITCSDKAHRPRSVNKVLHVQVTDLNDNVPQCEKNSYVIYIEENNKLDVELLKIKASDLDAGKNAELSYTLHENAYELFNIQSDSGILKTNSAFDREKISDVTFGVIISDKGTPIRSSTCTVSVHILDVNDNPPAFNQSHGFAFGVFENDPPKTIVGKITAFDPDFENEGIRFIMAPRSSSKSMKSWELHPQTGVISTKVSLDREKHSAHYFQVVAYDIGSSTLSSTTSVTIYIADRNDHAPKFQKPNQKTFYVSGSAPVHHLVTRVIAKDADLGNNAAISYALSSLNGKNDFYLNPSTGVLTLNKAAKRISEGNHEVQITAKDKGHPTLQTNLILTISVNFSLPFRLPRQPHETQKPSVNVVIVSFFASALLLVSLLVIAIALINSKKRLKKDLVKLSDAEGHTNYK